MVGRLSIFFSFFSYDTLDKEKEKNASFNDYKVKIWNAVWELASANEIDFSYEMHIVILIVSERTFSTW